MNFMTTWTTLLIPRGNERNRKSTGALSSSKKKIYTTVEEILRFAEKCQEEIAYLENSEEEALKLEEKSKNSGKTLNDVLIF